MARRRNLKGTCAKREIETNESDMCDYFEQKKTGTKPSCRHCIHFKIKQVTVQDDKKHQDV